MFSFFKRKNKNDDKLKNDGRETAVDAGDVTGESSEAGTEDVTTDLSLHPNQTVSQEQMYVLRFLQNELPPLKKNQLSLSGIEWNETPDGIAVSAFVRNTVERELTLGMVPLLLVNEDGKLKARSTFPLGELGSLPPNTSRPWTFRFPKSAVNEAVELAKENWSIAFDLSSQKHQLDLDEKWEKALPPEQKENLKKMVESMGPPAKDQLNFTGITVATLEDGNLSVSLLIRNGYGRHVNIEKLPLQLIDASEEVVAQGQFNVGDFQVKANTTKPWTFVFPASLIQKENPDFSKWKVRVVQEPA